MSKRQFTALLSRYIYVYLHIYLDMCSGKYCRLIIQSLLAWWSVAIWCNYVS